MLDQMLRKQKTSTNKLQPIQPVVTPCVPLYRSVWDPIIFHIQRSQRTRNLTQAFMEAPGHPTLALQVISMSDVIMTESICRYNSSVENTEYMIHIYHTGMCTAAGCHVSFREGLPTLVVRDFSFIQLITPQSPTRPRVLHL